MSSHNPTFRTNNINNTVLYNKEKKTKTDITIISLSNKGIGTISFLAL
jgi:hypothetical protein